MSKSMHKNMDPLEIENRFSNENGFFYDQDETQLSYEDFKPFLNKLPEKEIDLIVMYYYLNKKQKEIAEIFGVTQGAISHRLSRASKRLKFLRDMPKLPDDIFLILKPHFNEFEIDLINIMIDTTCQSKTAKILNEKYKFSGNDKMTQVKIRHKFERSIGKLRKIKKTNKNLSICIKLLEYIQSNLYMLHEVVLPHFDRGYKVRIDKIC
jgi:predicted transcriptional regulator